jgi:hypothetical protein
MAARPNFWFWPIPAAATVELPGPWKTELQDRVGNPFGLAVTLAHYPTGAAKWNPEHRLFSEISKNWAAEPLDITTRCSNPFAPPALEPVWS